MMKPEIGLHDRYSPGGLDWMDKGPSEPANSP